jgi:hypothetical protein
LSCRYLCQHFPPHMAFRCGHLSVSKKERYVLSFHIRETTIGGWAL